MNQEHAFCLATEKLLNITVPKRGQLAKAALGAWLPIPRATLERACSLYRTDCDAAAIWGSTCYRTLHWATLAVAQYQFCPSADCPR
jgi:hypothetical protein